MNEQSKMLNNYEQKILEKDKPDTMIVVFEEYYELNQFEGEWETQVKLFSSKEDSLEFIENIKSNPYIKNIYNGILLGKYKNE